MLLPVLRGPPRGRGGENETGALAQRAHDVAEGAVAARLRELVVEFAVQAHEVLYAAGERGGIAARQSIPQLGDHLRVVMPRR